MTQNPVQPAKSGRPGAILAALLAILLVCTGVIFWDQSQQTQGSSNTVNNGTTNNTTAPVQNGSNDGFGGLK